MVFETAAFWEARTRAGDDATWLCQSVLLVDALQEQKDCKLFSNAKTSALVVGSGTSNLPELIYDRGIKEVVMVELNQEAVNVVVDRSGGRKGLRCLHADIAAPDFCVPAAGPGAAAGSAALFDVVVDRGTLDCILAGRDGRAQGMAAVRTMHACLKTPGTLLLVSHSPPPDRMDILNTVYWHEMKVYVTHRTPWEELSEVKHKYEERLEPWDEAAQYSGSPDFLAGNAFVYMLTK